MGRSVTISTPIPTLEEVGKRLKMSKARQRRLIEIVRGDRNGQSPERQRYSFAEEFMLEHSNSRNGDSGFRNQSNAATDSEPRKKSKRAATS
jgi:hypothetical protein